MKACRVLLFVLFCVCAVVTADVHFRLDRHDDHETELELSIGHHDDHDTECNLKIHTGKLDHPTEKLVLVVYTGGTIGMVLEHGVLVPKPHALLKYLRNLVMFHDEKYAKETDLYDRYKDPEQICVLPLNKHKQRIVYRILEYSPLLDSSNMSEKDWIKIVKTIEENYEDYDGFVILHGTDTMAYTSSALSFMCENLAKPVIVTGSQIPIYEMRTDGRDNLMGALLIAGHCHSSGQHVIPEVCLYFYDKLYRGNRVTKVDAESFRAFNSPNLSPLADVGVDITVNWDIVRKANTTAKFNVSEELNRNVGLLRIYPGITATTVKAFLQPPMEGVVLETFGAGNAPDKNKDLMEELKKATARGIIIINITQCLRGTVIMLYATGKALVDAGVISGGDMTQEAALSKLSYVLAKSELDLKAKKEMMEKDLRGERGDLDGDKLYLSDSRFVRYKESDK